VSVNELRERRATAVKSMQQIIHQASQAERDLSDEEAARFHELETQAKELKERIETKEADARLRKAIGDLGEGMHPSTKAEPTIPFGARPLALDLEDREELRKATRSGHSLKKEIGILRHKAVQTPQAPFANRISYDREVFTIARDAARVRDLLPVERRNSRECTSFEPQARPQEPVR
jgi:hypothetical protein